jgi:hypothetical protein
LCIANTLSCKFLYFKILQKSRSDDVTHVAGKGEPPDAEFYGLSLSMRRTEMTAFVQNVLPQNVPLQNVPPYKMSHLQNVPRSSTSHPQNVPPYKTSYATKRPTTPFF